MPTPHIVWYVDPTGACKVFMHADDILRSISAPTVEAAQKMIVSVAIDGFGMAQVDAQKLAQDAVAIQVATADLPKKLSDHITLLQEQMSDHDKELTKTTADKLSAEAQVRLLTTENEKLMRDLDAANATIAEMKQAAATPAPAPIPVPMPVPPSAPHNPPAVGGVVPTPEGETPPAAVPAPPAQSGTAPIEAVAGGKQEASGG